jgi:formamidopyrimidine-DNA glycosylase
VPELPEVEVLVRRLKPLLLGKTIRRITVHRPRVIRPTSIPQLSRALRRARFESISRRGKFILFTLLRPDKQKPVTLIGHLGMTGRMYLLAKEKSLPRHTAVHMDLGGKWFVFEDTRYFGRLTLDTTAVDQLGPEPLSDQFTPELFAAALKRSSQPIKVKLLDQKLVAGIGNIYASEALFRSGTSPAILARDLRRTEIMRLWEAIREVLSQAIARGGSLELNFEGTEKRDNLFYFGRAGRDEVLIKERFLVYDRRGEPCVICGSPIQRSVQAARSTFYCKKCQSPRGMTNLE